jgi:hypothetical protein
MKYPFSKIVMISFTMLLSTLLVIYSTLSIHGSDINDSSDIMGIVKDGSFIVVETNETKKLTSIGLVEATTPESGLINLTQYEGKAILVSSPQISDNEWLFGATIIDIADPIVTKLVKEVFNLN